jgi:unsaturated rhamnogalacturonyl hydrolase
LSTRTPAAHFGDAPADGGPYATDLSPALNPAAIDKALRKVADWQLARTSRISTASGLRACCTGFMAASEATGDPKYRDAMLAMSKQFDWDQMRDRLPNADDVSIGQTYLDLYMEDKRPSLHQPDARRTDDLLRWPPSSRTTRAFPGGGAMRCSWRRRSGSRCTRPRASVNTSTTCTT